MHRASWRFVLSCLVSFLDQEHWIHLHIIIWSSALVGLQFEKFSCCFGGYYFAIWYILKELLYSSSKQTSKLSNFSVQHKIYTLCAYFLLFFFFVFFSKVSIPPLSLISFYVFDIFPDMEVGIQKMKKAFSCQFSKTARDRIKAAVETLTFVTSDRYIGQFCIGNTWKFQLRVHFMGLIQLQIGCVVQEWIFCYNV